MGADRFAIIFGSIFMLCVKLSYFCDSEHSLESMPHETLLSWKE
jgi:hypothetical protein